MNALPAVVIIGGIAYVATQTDATSPGNVYPGGKDVTGGTYPGATIDQLTRIAGGEVVAVNTGLNSRGQQTYKIANFQKAALGAVPKSSAWESSINNDSELARKFQTIEAAAAKAYNDANEVAKAQSAQYLNKELKLDPPLNGHEDWKTVSAVVGGATGGAIGGAIGGPIGAKLGALAGAYLGVKLEELLEKNWDEVKDWVKDKWGDVEDFAEDAYDYVAGVVPW